jgi:Cu+-exporting ATPase
VFEFEERPGKGIIGTIDGHEYKIGSPEFVNFKEKINVKGSVVFVSIDEQIRGFFFVKSSVRQNIKGMLRRLDKKCRALLSGDGDADKIVMTSLFPPQAELNFNQRPADKMGYIQKLQERGTKVLMVGDGLNDAGALKQADVGIAVTDDTSLFTPGSDAILQGNQLQNLDKFLSLANASSKILKAAFTISFMYNAIALSFAVTGNLTPLVAAILMPVSSVSVVSFSTIAVNLVSKRKLKNSRL